MERPSIAAAAFDRPGVRIRTLAALRWIAISGQFVTLLFVGLYLKYPLLWPSLIAAVAASAVLNIGLTTLYPRNARLQGPDLALHLAFDLVQAGVLLFLTGGLTNPFAILLIVPVTIAATLLTARHMMALGAMAFGILIVLWFWARPLPWAGPPLELPTVYRFGIVVSLALAIGFLAIYLWMVSAEARDRARALVATEAALTREAKMSALGSLAAAAAHELGGPLGHHHPHRPQPARRPGRRPRFRRRHPPARGRSGAQPRHPRPHRPPRRSRGPVRRTEPRRPAPRSRAERRARRACPSASPRRRRNRMSAARPSCCTACRTSFPMPCATPARPSNCAPANTANEIGISVLDDGAGFAPDILPRLGEPDLGPSHSGAGGTGLGIFIATTLIERTGGRLAFRNHEGGGAQVDVRWPRPHIEAEPQE